MDTSFRLLFAFMLCALVFAGLWYDTVHMHSLTAPINLFIQQHFIAAQTPTTPWAEFYRECVTFINLLGKEPVVFPAMGLLLVVLAIQKEWKGVLYCLIASGVMVGLALLCKELIYSPRPYPFEAEHDSFPSGHTVRASLWCGLYLFMDRLKYISLSRFAKWGLFLIPLMVGFSRLAVSRHWFSDVIAGYTLVLGIFFLLYALILWIDRSKT